MQTKEEWIKALDLQPHPEGGYFKEMLQSPLHTTALDGQQKPLYSSIYFMLTPESPSHFHQLTSDEVWYYHAGAVLTVHVISPDGQYYQYNLGNNPAKGQVLQALVPAGSIFGSTVEHGFAVVSCMVSPAFSYEDFKLFDQSTLLAKFPQHKAIINRLAYKEIPLQ